MKSKSIIAVPVLSTMSTEDLRATAKAAGVKCGKSRKDTITNMTKAIDAGALHFKSQVTLSVNPAKPGESTQRKTLYGATLRTYKSGPGDENTVWLTPANAVSGSPSAPAGQ